MNESLKIIEMVAPQQRYVNPKKMVAIEQNIHTMNSQTLLYEQNS